MSKITDIHVYFCENCDDKVVWIKRSFSEPQSYRATESSLQRIKRISANYPTRYGVADSILWAKIRIVTHEPHNSS